MNSKLKPIIIGFFIFFIICLLPINKYFKLCYSLDMVNEKDKLECDPSRGRGMLCKNPLRKYLSDFNTQLILFILLMYIMFH